MTRARATPEGRARVGVDGLTVAELRRSRLVWWDGAFATALLDSIAPGVERIVEIGCGLAQAAHTLVPPRPGLHYIGIDIDPERLRSAAKILADDDPDECDYTDRVHLVQAAAERLPLCSESADAVLSLMTLQHIAAVDKALGEVWRVLRTGGHFIAGEPDNLGSRYYFDGVLDAISAAMGALKARVHSARAPRNTAIGPAVPAALAAARFRVVSFRPYLVHQSGRASVGDFAAQLRQIADILIASLPEPERGTARSATMAIIHEWAQAQGEHRTGYASTMTPIFLCTGQKTDVDP